jgi:hypothetical protein
MRPTLIRIICPPTCLALSLLFVACTSERRGLESETSVAAKPIGSQSVGANSQSCTSIDLSSFEKPAGEVIDLNREALPKGLYLATLSEVFLEKKSEKQIEGAPVVRFLAREVAGSRNGEIVCSENIEKVGPDFDLAIMGLVKFDTSRNPNGDDFTARQFYVFSDRSGYGVILSNPEIASKEHDLKKFLNSGMSRGQLVRLSEREYALRMVRERDGVRVRLSIRLELVPAQDTLRPNG